MAANSFFINRALAANRALTDGSEDEPGDSLDSPLMSEVLRSSARCLAFTAGEWSSSRRRSNFPGDGAAEATDRQ